MSDFVHLESELTTQLGLMNRGRLRELRTKHLLLDVDFKIVKKRVAYSQVGVEKIRGALSLPPEKNAPAGASAQPAPLPEPVRLLVWNCRLVNKKIVLAYRPGTDPRFAENLVRVRVRSSENFMKFVNGAPMELMARKIQGDLFELATRCPRWKGRW